MKTIAEVIRVQAARQPEQLGIWHESGETSYAELDRRSSQVANALIAAGIPPKRIAKEIPFMGALLKKPEDIEAVEGGARVRRPW